MQLPSSMTISAAEDLLSRVERGTVGDLKIPTRGRHQAAGGEAAMVQALCTWANRTDTAPLVTYAEGPDDEVQIDRLIGRLYGLVGVLVADSIVSLRGPDLTEQLQRAAMRRLATLQSENPEGGSRGAQLEILCFDYLAKSYPRAFYTSDDEGLPQIRDLPAFNRFAAAILKELLPALAKSLPSDFIYALGGALHELFRNTEEHGRVNDKGDVPAKSVRGFHARRHPIPPEALEVIASESAPLAAYCTRLRPPREGRRDIQLIELSVFDSGPGMAASLAGRPLADISLAEELHLVRQCFRENVSCKSLSSSGLGLPTVIDLLRERNGFLRLRTGRMALYCDLGAEAEQEFGEPPTLKHWIPDQDAAPIATGTAFTLMFPLGV